MNEQEQQIESAENVRYAINDCVVKLQEVRDINKQGQWSDVITNTIYELFDARDSIANLLIQDAEDNCGDDYERLTGHEMGLLSGRV